MSYTTCMISLPSLSASSIVCASLYTLMIGSVFDLRRCTHLSSKSIFTPSMSVMLSPAYIPFTLSRMASMSVSGVRSMRFFAMKYSGYVAFSSLALHFL